MKKIINISVIAALAILPLAANAEDYSINDPATANPATAASTGPGWALAQANSEADGKLATAGYVKGAYNQTMKAVNKVATTASFAGTASELADTHFNSADKTSAAKAANAAMAAAAAAQADVDVVEATIGNTTLTTTAQTLTGAIEEVKDAVEAVDTGVMSVTEGTTDGTVNVDGTDVAVHGLGSAAYTASTAYATAAQGTKADNAETNIGTMTNLQTDATNLVAAINEVKETADAAVTDADIADFATQDGVTATITASTVSGSVPVVTTWGTDAATTVAITASLTGASYREPTPAP